MRPRRLEEWSLDSLWLLAALIPPGACLEAMAREESWLQMHRGDGTAVCFDALDAVRRVIDAAQAIGEEHVRLETLGRHFREAIFATAS